MKYITNNSEMDFIIVIICNEKYVYVSLNSKGDPLLNYDMEKNYAIDISEPTELLLRHYPIVNTHTLTIFNNKKEELYYKYFHSKTAMILNDISKLMFQIIIKRLGEKLKDSDFCNYSNLYKASKMNDVIFMVERCKEMQDMSLLAKLVKIQNGLRNNISKFLTINPLKKNHKYPGNSDEHGKNPSIDKMCTCKCCMEKNFTINQISLPITNETFDLLICQKTGLIIDRELITYYIDENDYKELKCNTQKESEVCKMHWLPLLKDTNKCRKCP